MPRPIPRTPNGATAINFLSAAKILANLSAKKWAKEFDYKLKKALWSYTDNRIAVRFRYEWHDSHGQGYRSYGNELWQFDKDGYIERREASINDVAIEASQRQLV